MPFSRPPLCVDIWSPRMDSDSPCKLLFYVETLLALFGLTPHDRHHHDYVLHTPGPGLQHLLSPPPQTVPTCIPCLPCLGADPTPVFLLPMWTPCSPTPHASPLPLHGCPPYPVWAQTPRAGPSPSTDECLPHWVQAPTPHARPPLSMDAYLALLYLKASGLNCAGRGRSKVAFKTLYKVTQTHFKIQ